MRGSHPDIAPDQHGATAHRIGPRAKALAHVLHYGHGVPVRKTPAILEELTGLRLTQGTITQDAMRQSEGGVGAQYERLRAAVPEQAVVHTDDTGWRVGGETAFLMNAEKLEGVVQQKCLAHLIRNAAEVAKQKTGRAKHFSSRLKYLLQTALALGATRDEVSPGSYRKRVRNSMKNSPPTCETGCWPIPTTSGCSTAPGCSTIWDACSCFSRWMASSPPTTGPNAICVRQ